MLKVTPKKLDKLIHGEISCSKSVYFYQCGDETNKSKLVFGNVETVIFNDCNKNFMYYWLSPIFFPKLKNVYTDRICDGEIFRFRDINIYTTEYSFKKYKDSLWNDPINNVNIEKFERKHFETFEKLSNIE